jgi:hypothetical protein
LFYYVIRNMTSINFRNLLKSIKARKKLFVTVFAAFLIVAILSTTWVLTSTSFELRNKAATYKTAGVKLCNGKINVEASANGINYSLRTTVPVDYNRYYLKITDAVTKQPCSTAFEVMSQVCKVDGTECGQWGRSANWAYFMSNKEGIARIDWPAKIPENTYNAKLRPRGTKASFSNEYTVVVSSKANVSSTSISTAVDLTKYVQFNVGDSYIYRGYNWMASQNDIAARNVDFQLRKTTPVVGTSRVIIEDEVVWGDVQVRPWRFTKDKPEMYWGPKDPFVTVGANSWTRTEDLRWMIVSPNYKVTDSRASHFNSYLWGIGHKTYEWSANLKDLGAWNRTYNYASATGKYPQYNLGQKNQKLPFSFVSGIENAYLSSDGNVYTPIASRQNTDIKAPQIITSEKPSMGWFMRMDKVSKPMIINGVTYTDVIKADYYEGHIDLARGVSFRETWYYAKDIGAIRIDSKYFNVDGKSKNKLACFEDPDCMSDDIIWPHSRLDLTTYQPNKKLTVQVSPDAVNYCSNTTTLCSSVVPKSGGYTLRIADSKFTGYLEAQITSNPSSPLRYDRAGVKWMWAENGIVRVSPEILKTIATGSYRARFRIWAPNETFPNERRVITNSTPWSNEIETIIR